MRYKRDNRNLRMSLVRLQTRLHVSFTLITDKRNFVKGGMSFGFKSLNKALQGGIPINKAYVIASPVRTREPLRSVLLSSSCKSILACTLT